MFQSRPFFFFHLFTAKSSKYDDKRFIIIDGEFGKTKCLSINATSSLVGIKHLRELIHSMFSILMQHCTLSYGILLSKPVLSNLLFYSVFCDQDNLDRKPIILVFLMLCARVFFFLE